MASQKNLHDQITIEGENSIVWRRQGRNHYIMIISTVSMTRVDRGA